MQLSTYLTPAALAREAERQRHMAKHAANCPTGYSRDAWKARCMKRAHELDIAARRDS